MFKTAFDPSDKIGPRITQLLIEEGVIHRAILNTVAYSPPLVITESDVDEMIYLESQRNADGSMTVSTYPDKVRNTFEAITFTISADREVSRSDFIDVEKTNRDYALIPDLPENYIAVVEEANLNDLVNNKNTLLSSKKNYAEIESSPNSSSAIASIPDNEFQKPSIVTLKFLDDTWVQLRDKNDEIVTNIDLDTEYRYLIALNNELRNTDEDTLKNFSEEAVKLGLLPHQANGIMKYYNTLISKTLFDIPTYENNYLIVALKYLVVDLLS